MLHQQSVSDHDVPHVAQIARGIDVARPDERLSAANGCRDTLCERGNSKRGTLTGAGVVERAHHDRLQTALGDGTSDDALGSSLRQTVDPAWTEGMILGERHCHARANAVDLRRGDGQQRDAVGDRCLDNRDRSADVRGYRPCRIRFSVRSKRDCRQVGDHIWVRRGYQRVDC